MPRPITVVFDMDGVIAHGTRETVYSDKAGWRYDNCEPIEETIHLMHRLRQNDVYIKIHTARWHRDLRLTYDWLKKHGVPFDELIMGKPSADLYIDDKNFPAGYTPEDGWFQRVIDMARLNKKEQG